MPSNKAPLQEPGRAFRPSSVRSPFSQTRRWRSRPTGSSRGYTASLSTELVLGPRRSDFQARAGSESLPGAPSVSVHLSEPVLLEISVCSGSQSQAPAYVISSIPQLSPGVSVPTRAPTPNLPFSSLCHAVLPLKDWGVRGGDPCSVTT